MWTKEAPKEPGFYWIRTSARRFPGQQDDLCIVNVWEGQDGLVAAYPGSDYRAPIAGLRYWAIEWWPEPIRPPGGPIESAIEFDCKVCGTRHEPCIDMARRLKGMRIESSAPTFGFSKAEAQRAAGLRTQPKPGDIGFFGIKWVDGVRMFTCTQCGDSTEACEHNKSVLDIGAKLQINHLRERAEHD